MKTELHFAFDADQPEKITPDAIYAEFPRKQGKIDALKAIKKAMGRESPVRLLERTRAYRAAVDLWSREDRQFVPHPATWFNRGSYDDDPETWVRQSHDKSRASFA